MSNEKILNRLRKIKALAKDGTDGEKTAAADLLAKLLKAYNIDERQISDDADTKILRCWFKVAEEQEKFFFQIVASVVGGGAGYYIRNSKPVKKIREYGIDMTKIDAIEIFTKFDYFWNLYKQELDTFFLAFIIRHELYRTDTSLEYSELTSEERAKRIRAEKMSWGMVEGEFRKRLENKM